MDTLITVPNYPKEDTKLRATSTKIAGGGPAATGIVAAQKLGESTEFIGVLSSDNGGKFLKEDFEKYGVYTKNIDIIDGYRSFTSTIWLSGDTASRTCVFDKGNLPALKLDDQKKKAVTDAQVLLVDGNEMDAAVQAAEIARKANTTVLYDCGGLYDGVERLLSLTDVMIPSEEFALAHTGCDNVKDAATKLFSLYGPRVVVITRGKIGGILYDGKEFFEYPAFLVEAVDSNGSGDVFHGAYAAALCKGYDYKKSCIFSSAVSAIKCTGYGARESVPTFDTVKSFLKEKNYEL